MNTARIISLGLVCWVLTTIVVDSVLFAPLRERLARAAARERFGDAAVPPFGVVAALIQARLTGKPLPSAGWRGGVSYLVSCNLCAGTWIGLGLALVAGGQFDVRLIGWVLSGLLYKAVAHALLVVQRALELVGT